MPPSRATPHIQAAAPAALIEHIVARYHEGHRRALPGLMADAEAARAGGLDPGCVDALRRFGDALEQHMFKEEMRLFPMMEQGGNTLIGRLIEDLHREHVAHANALEDFRARLGARLQAAPADAALRRLIEGIDRLAQELAAHMHAEDEQLFPQFTPHAAAAARSAFNP